MRTKVAICAAASATLVALLVPAGAATGTVEIPGQFFSPKRITIFVGDTVRWVSRDGGRHSVTANSSSVALGESFSSSRNCPGGLLFDDCMRRGDTYSHTFTKAGAFTYRCNVHGADTTLANCAMCGQVIVVQRAAPSKSPTTTASPTSTGSPTSTASPTASGSPTTTGSPRASETPGAGGAGDGSIPVIPIAASAVALLGFSAYAVYRSMLRR